MQRTYRSDTAVMKGGLALSAGTSRLAHTGLQWSRKTGPSQLYCSLAHLGRIANIHFFLVLSRHPASPFKRPGPRRPQTQPAPPMTSTQPVFSGSDR